MIRKAIIIDGMEKERVVADIESPFTELRMVLSTIGCKSPRFLDLNEEWRKKCEGTSYDAPITIEDITSEGAENWEVILYGNPIYQSSTIPSNEAIYKLIKCRIAITHTIIFSNTPSIFDSLVENEWPSKNVGEIIRILSFSDDVERTEKMEEKVDHKTRIRCVDGIIAAGKSYRIKKLMERYPQIYFIPEPEDMIYSIIKECKDASKKERQERVEHAVVEYEKEALSKVPSDQDVIYIERNWLYSDWIFGVMPEPFPSFSRELEKALSPFRIEGTFVIWTPPELAYDWAKKRGAHDDINLLDERRLDERLRILFHSPYEWAYARVMEGQLS